MTQYKKQSTVKGERVNKSELKTGMFAKVKSETKPVQSDYGEQDVAQVAIKGFEGVKNVGLNKTTINGLIDAYGENSVDWIDKVLTVNVEKGIVGGKRVIILYLVPENYTLKENTDGYMEIVNPDNDSIQKPPEEDIPVINEDEERINPEDIPF